MSEMSTRYMTEHDAAREFGVDRRTLRDERAAGRLSAEQVFPRGAGHQDLYDADELDRWAIATHRARLHPQLTTIDGEAILVVDDEGKTP